MKTIRLNRFKPRDYQLPIFDAFENKGYKKLMIVASRRAGKDITAFNLMVRAAFRKIGVYYYIFPTYAQAKKAIWDSITNDGVRFLDYIPEELVASKNSQEMKLTLVNGSLIQFVGSTDYDRLMGTNPQGCVFSEYALQDPMAYKYIRPILAANGGWVLFASTPRGRNALYDLYKIAEQADDWFCTKITVEDAKHIPLEVIQKEIEEGIMSEDLVQQEYYCFPGDTGILCPDGVKRIDEVCVDDLVVSHSGRARRVINKFERDYSGNLIKIRSYGSSDPILCTPNHPIRVYQKATQKYEWKKAKDITKEDRLVFPKQYKSNLKIISEELCMLMAWYITEGSSAKNAVQFSLGGDLAINRVKELLSVLGFKYCAYKGTATNIIVNSCALSDFMRISCGSLSYKKRIPFNLIAGYESKFFDELIKGDGCRSVHKGRNRICYTTVSVSLAYQIQILANSIGRGYACGISKRPAHIGKIQGRSVNCRESYQLGIAKVNIRARHEFLLRSKNSINAAISSIETVEYVGKVYNLGVQYDESYIANGRAVHNCSWSLGVEGGYYTKIMDRIKREGHITRIPHELGYKVHTAWDLGVRDSTAIIFFQLVGKTVRIIDYYENHSVGLEHYVSILNKKGYVYGKHVSPHDIRVREFSSGISRFEKARQLGVTFTVADRLSIEDGIEAVRTTLQKSWFDEVKCSELIKALENYRREYDARKKIYKPHPHHDWCSHACDAFRMLAISLPKLSEGTSPEELERRYREAVYGEQSNLPPFFR